MYCFRSLESRETGVGAVSSEVRIQEIIIFLPGSFPLGSYSAFGKRVGPQNDNFIGGFFEEGRFYIAAPTMRQKYFLCPPNEVSLTKSISTFYELFIIMCMSR
jgi:hypothetical protein